MSHRLITSIVWAAIALLVFGAQGVPAQADSTHARRNHVSLELLGNGVLYSINYERRVTSQVVARIGVTEWSEPCFMECSGVDRVSAVPLTMSALFPVGRHTIEWGIGMLVGRRRDHSGARPLRAPTAILAMRYGGGRTPFVFRWGLMPVLYPSEMADGDAYNFLPLPGFSLGFTF